MPRVIFKCPHIRPGTKGAATHLGHYVRYVATREGVELPGREDLTAKRGNYVGYIAQRPCSHGLFSDTDEPLVLSKIAKEVADHPGSVWLPIISLCREDAARLGYDNAAQWKTLLRAYAPTIAEAMKIPLEQFRWYAAFHDEGHHPHVHMVCYSADSKSGFLTKEGIAKIKSGLAKNIFRQELTELYQQQTQRRDELVRDAGEVMAGLLQQMQSGTLEDEHIEKLMRQLARKLKTTSGKKQYGYLRAPLKALVDEVVDELAKDPRVAAAYDLWYQLREEVLRTYKEDLPERLPLSQQKELKRVKNLVIEEAVRLGGYLEVYSPAEGEDETEADDLQQVIRLTQKAEEGDARAMYALGKLHLKLGNIPIAVGWFQKSAELGDRYAQYALGKLYLLGDGVRRDKGAAVHWLTLAATQGDQHAQHLLDHLDDHPPLLSSTSRLLYCVGALFQEQAPLSAGVYFTDSKLRRKIREKKIAMGHKPGDHPSQAQKA